MSFNSFSLCWILVRTYYVVYFGRNKAGISRSRGEPEPEPENKCQHSNKWTPLFSGLGHYSRQSLLVIGRSWQSLINYFTSLALWLRREFSTENNRQSVFHIGLWCFVRCNMYFVHLILFYFGFAAVYKVNYFRITRHWQAVNRNYVWWPNLFLLFIVLKISYFIIYIFLLLCR